MSRVYRVLRRRYASSPFDGEGAYRYGGRWSSPGTRLCYTSEHQSLALLEYFVHLDKDDPPADLVIARAEVPHGLARERVEADELPRNWREAVAPAQLARVGDDFVRRGEHCLLAVPSVVAPEENNCLINPEHPDFKRIVMSGVAPVNYDPRMFVKQRTRRRERRS